MTGACEPPIDPPEPKFDARCSGCGEDFVSEDHQTSDAVMEFLGSQNPQDMCSDCRAILIIDALHGCEVEAIKRSLAADQAAVLNKIHGDQLRVLHAKIRDLQSKLYQKTIEEVL